MQQESSFGVQTRSHSLSDNERLQSAPCFLIVGKSRPCFQRVETFQFETGELNLLEK